MDIRFGSLSQKITIQDVTLQSLERFINNSVWRLRSTQDTVRVKVSDMNFPGEQTFTHSGISILKVNTFTV